MGTNVLIVMPGSTTVSGVRGGQGGAMTLTVSDAADLKKRSPLLSETGWARREVMQIVNGNRNWNGPVNGISPSYLTIRDWSFMSGGAFTQTDLDAAARVALIGQTTLENLFDPTEEASRRDNSDQKRAVPNRRCLGAQRPVGPRLRSGRCHFHSFHHGGTEGVRQSISRIGRGAVRVNGAEC